MNGNMLKGHLDMLILATVEHESLHGYGIIKKLSQRSGGVFELPEGTVYPALRRLEAAKRVRSKWKVVEGRRRRLYALTASGRTALGREQEGWKAFQVAVGQVLEARA